MMTTVELPYEIWLHILHFLSPKIIRQLRLVNTVLYNLSLDEHYRITQIGYHFKSPWDLVYPPLRYIGNARRVRVLLIRNGSIRPQKDESPRASTSKPSFWKLIKKFSRIYQVVGHEPKTNSDGLLDAVPGLTKLTTLDICLPQGLEDPFHQMKIKVLEAGWPIFSANLTTFSLTVPLEEFHLFVPFHNSPSFLRLESFSIDIYNSNHTSEPNELMRRTLLPFLINLGPTLRSLKLAARGNVDMSSILAKLQHMPYLRKLDISHPFLGLELTCLIGHHLFLEAHQSQLQHLTFYFFLQSFLVDITNELFNQQWCRVSLPELQSFNFRLSHLIGCCEVTNAVPYLQRQIRTVKSLEVHPLCFSYDHMASIITGSRTGEYHLMALRTLDMRIQCFSPDLLSLLADRAPHLRSLKLKAIVFGPDKQLGPVRRNRVPEFCEALQSRCFPDWGLYEIDVLYCNGFLVLPSLRNQCKVALFRTLPNLRLFCGLGPKECWPENHEID